MVLLVGGDVTVGYFCYECLWGVQLPVVHHTPRGINQSYHNVISFLFGYYKNESIRQTWKMFLVITIRLNGSLKKHHEYIWYQDDIYLEDHRLVGLLQSRISRGGKLKHPNSIE